MKRLLIIAFGIGFAFLADCEPSLTKSNQPANTSPASPAPRGTASYTLDIEVQFDSEITQGQQRLMVELRQGALGASWVFDTQYIKGQFATVDFTNLPAGSYFVAIGNGDSVAVGPVRQFADGQRIHTRMHITSTYGNVGAMRRSGL